MKTKILGMLLATVASVAPLGSASAATFNFFYNTDLVATISTSGGTVFDMDFVYAPGGSASFINDVFLYHPTATLANSTFTNLGPEAASASFGPPNNGGWIISFPTGNNDNRFIVGESTGWSIVTSDASGWDFGRLHINAFLNGNSIKLDACLDGDPNCTPERDPLPEPGTLALLGLGLIGLGASRRRTNR